jgi:hypothetical protein
MRKLFRALTALLPSPRLAWTCFTAVLLSAAPAAALGADWTLIESRNFVILTDLPESVGRRHARTLEVFDAALRLRHGISTATPARRKLPIYLVEDRRSLRLISPRIADTVAGFYVATEENIFAAAAAEHLDFNEYLLHEYVHHFMLNYFPSSYPSWLVEGYAEYYMTFRLNPDGYEIGRPGSRTMERTDRLIPMEMFLKGTPAEMRKSGDSSKFYYQAWLLTHWFLADAGRRKHLDEFIRGVLSGGDPVETMTRVTGLAPEALTNAVRQYAKGALSYQKIGIAALRLPEPTITRVSDKEAAARLVTLRVQNDDGKDAADNPLDGPVLLRAAREAAGRAGGRTGDLLLARAELKLGDAALAERLLQARLAQSAEDAEALELLASARLKESMSAPDRADSLRGDARVFASRAYKADPNRYQALLAYLRGREGLPSYPSDNDLVAVQDALDLAPQVAGLRLLGARALIAKGRSAEAGEVLAPLVNDPHGGDVSDAARALLAAATTEPSSPNEGALP